MKINESSNTAVTVYTNTSKTNIANYQTAPAPASNSNPIDKLSISNEGRALVEDLNYKEDKTFDADSYLQKVMTDVEKEKQNSLKTDSREARFSFHKSMLEKYVQNSSNGVFDEEKAFDADSYLQKVMTDIEKEKQNSLKTDSREARFSFHKSMLEKYVHNSSNGFFDEEKTFDADSYLQKVMTGIEKEKQNSLKTDSREARFSFHKSMLEKYVHNSSNGVSGEEETFDADSYLQNVMTGEEKEKQNSLKTDSREARFSFHKSMLEKYVQNTDFMKSF